MTYDMKTKVETGSFFGKPVYSEGRGGALEFSRSSKEKDAPEEYFEQKSKFFRL